MWVPGVLAVSVLVVLAAGSWAIIATASRPVGVTAVDTFAMRQRLHLPGIVHNPHVLNYLTTTRRWRVSGLVVAFVFGFGNDIRGGRISIDLGAAFLGWFAGALIAEWRLNVRRDAGRRTALLTRRSLRRYLGVPEISVMCLAMGVLVAMAGHALSYAPPVATVVVFAVSLAPAVVAALTARHILLRPAVESQPSVDHALRSRSLHALAGAVTTFALSGVAALLLLNPSESQLVPIAVLLGGAVVGGMIGVAPGPAS